MTTPQDVRRLMQTPGFAIADLEDGGKPYAKLKPGRQYELLAMCRSVLQASNPHATGHQSVSFSPEAFTATKELLDREFDRLDPIVNPHRYDDTGTRIT